MAAGQKKVILRTLTGTLAWGYLQSTLFVLENNVPLMATDGRTNSFPIRDIKTISYVKDFNLDDPVDPERLTRRTFPARPRGDGIWLRLTFLKPSPEAGIADDILEGLTPLDLPALDALLADRGILLIPPDPRGNTQRIFVPRSALQSLEVLGYVTAPSRRLSRPSRTNNQPTLFPEPGPNPTPEPNE
jgi:hypothetical protein